MMQIKSKILKNKITILKKWFSILINLFFFTLTFIPSNFYPIFKFINNNISHKFINTIDMILFTNHFII
jgi:hypothetical protein